MVRMDDGSIQPGLDGREARALLDARSYAPTFRRRPDVLAGAAAFTLYWAKLRHTTGVRKRRHRGEFMRKAGLLYAILSAVLFALPVAAAAEGELVVYCTVQEEWCRPMVAAFEKATGIKVLMTRKSA